ncbi:MAG: hypothetical protein ABH950_02265 [Candidatus Altiarchaeota archaeon]
MKMQKMMAGLIIAVFLLSSIPLGLAVGPGRGGENQQMTQFSNMNETNQSRLQFRQTLGYGSDDDDENETDDSEDDEDVDELNEKENKRNKIVKQIQSMKKKVVKAQKTFKEAKEAYQEKKHEWLRARDRYRESLGNSTNNSEQAHEMAADYMKATIDATISYLETVETKVDDSNLPSEEKDRIKEEIADYIAQLEEYKTAIDEAETRSDLAKINKDLKHTLSDLKQAAHNYIKDLADKRLDHLIGKLEVTVDNLE